MRLVAIGVVLAVLALPTAVRSGPADTDSNMDDAAMGDRLFLSPQRRQVEAPLDDSHSQLLTQPPSLDTSPFPLHGGETITVVFFAHLMPNWEPFVTGYLTNLTACGLTGAATTVHVFISVKDQRFASRLQEGVEAVQRLLPGANVKLDSRAANMWEYPGIELVHRYGLANPSRDHYILYFHAKGIKRRRAEPQLFNAVVGNWRGVIDVFRRREDVNKIGLLASDVGFFWFNFWWTRGSVVSHTLTPMRYPDDRHYFMGWLALRRCGT